MTRVLLPGQSWGEGGGTIGENDRGDRNMAQRTKTPKFDQSFAFRQQNQLLTFMKYEY